MNKKKEVLNQNARRSVIFTLLTNPRRGNKKNRTEKEKSQQDRKRREKIKKAKGKRKTVKNEL